MRCFCCNRVLNTQEATRRFKVSGTFVDMCNTCLSTIDDEVEVSDGNTDDEIDKEKDDE